MPCVVWGFSTQLLGAELFWTLGELQVLFPLILSGGSFSYLNSFHTHECWSELNWKLRGGPLQVSGCFSRQQSSLWRCVLQNVAAWPPWNPTCVSLTWGESKDVFPELQPKNLLLEESWSNHRAPVICFPSLSGHCPSLLTTKFLENCCLPGFS